MKFNIFFTVKGPAGLARNVPNRTNPVDCENLASLLAMLANNLPHSPTLGVEVVEVEVRVELAS